MISSVNVTKSAVFMQCLYPAIFRSSCFYTASNFSEQLLFQQSYFFRKGTFKNSYFFRKATFWKQLRKAIFRNLLFQKRYFYTAELPFHSYTFKDLPWLATCSDSVGVLSYVNVIAQTSPHRHSLFN